MIWLLILDGIQSIILAVITTVGTLFTFFVPTEIESYYSSISLIFSGVRSLDVYLPMSELIVLATFGLTLKIALTVLINGWGIFRISMAFIMFWRR